jgi:hypothetical protein
MPSTLLLLLTILTVSAVPRHALPPGIATECRLRTSAAGVPMVEVDVAPGRAAWFVLDTGATGTTVRTDLARALGLEMSGHVRLGTLEANAAVPVARLRGLRITGVPGTHDVDVAVHDLLRVRQSAPQAEGILGQDVLSGYDYLIDLQRERLVVGFFPPPPHGVRLPLSWSAGRPVLHVRGAQGRHGLVLDSGADVLVIEAHASEDALGPAWGERRAASLDTHLGRRHVEVEHHATLRVADLSLGAVNVVRLPSEAWTMTPEVGLLPASLFGRVYVSARRGEAVLWAK